jgi:four helix bundle protein
MMGGRDYRDLVVWQEAMDLVVLVYRTSGDCPKQEQYGLTSQIRRAAVSVPANVAEGQGRRTNRDFRDFLSIAHGSLREVETHACIANRLGYLPEQELAKLIDLTSRIGRRTNRLAQSLDESG